MPALAFAAILLAVTACSKTPANSASVDSNAPVGTAEAPILRLGYFPNLTHVAAVLGDYDGTFQQMLGNTKLETLRFNAGPAAIEALVGGDIDAGFIGPNPAINSFAKSKGESLRIVAGATANGAALIVKPEINSIADLKGATIATPQLGGTQDVALRNFLLENGLKVDTTGGDDVSVASQDNAQTLDLFKSGQVQGGWLPEPWASRLVVEAGGKELINEKTLWSDGQFTTTVLIVSKRFLNQYPGTVRKLIQGELQVLKSIESDPAGAQQRLNNALKEYSGKALGNAVITRAFNEIIPTYDPLAQHLTEVSEAGVRAGTLKEAPELKQIYDLRILNSVLKDAGKPPVSAHKLGLE